MRRARATSSRTVPRNHVNDYADHHLYYWPSGHDNDDHHLRQADDDLFV
ncbi:hypothetical protein JOD54_001540 [Actinokineospora baliensis]|nr:hypothetical protein [Actinokineospora baliensis]